MKTPKPPAPIDYGAVAQQQVQSNIGGQQAQIDLSAINQSNPWGNLTYQRDANGKVTGVTGAFTPEQQQILDYLQSGQIGMGGASVGNVFNNFGQYTQDPDLVNKARGIGNQWMTDAFTNPSYFGLKARDQLRTSLINQGLKEDSPAYQQMMNQFDDQQSRSQLAMVPGFEQAAFGQGKAAYEEPLNIEQSLFAMTQPHSLPGELVNTPQANVGAADLTGMAKANQDQQYKNYLQQVARQNMMMNMGIGAVTGIMGMPVNPSMANATYGSQLMGGIFGGNNGGWQTSVAGA